MIPAGTRVQASVNGAFDWMKAPESLENYVRAELMNFGSVVSVDIDTALVSNQYVATVVYITNVAHGRLEDIRATLAGIFQSWNGIRPEVLLTSEGEGQHGATQSPLNPFPNFDPRQWTPLVIGVAVIVALFVFAPAVRRVSA